MTGIMRTSVPGFEALDPLALIAKVAQMGLDGLLTATLLDISPTLDPLALKAYRDAADRHGVRLAAGVGWFNPALPSRAAPTLALGAGDLLRGVTRLIQAGAAIGVTEMFFVVGMIEDRFAGAPSWADQLDAVAKGVEQLAPLLREHRVRLLVKTHEEITTHDILRLIETAGEDVLGVALDPVNFVVRMEEPVAAVRRIAHLVRQVHLDDAQVRFDGLRLRRYLAPFGEGDIDWAAILALVPRVPRWIELHRGQFAMDAFDAEWLRAQPDLVLEEYARVVKMAVRAPPAKPIDQDQPFARLDRLLGH